MAFHCNVCGSDLAGDYESCPVCEKVRAILGSFKAPDFVPPKASVEQVFTPVEPAAEADIPEEVIPAAEPEAEELFEPAEEELSVESEEVPFEEAELPEEEVSEPETAKEPFEEAEPEEPIDGGFEAEEPLEAESLFGELPEEEAAFEEEPVFEDETVEEPSAEEIFAEQEQLISEAEEVLEEQPEEIIDAAPEMPEDLAVVPAEPAKILPAEEPEVPEEETLSETMGLLERQLMEKAAGEPARKKRGGAIFGIIAVLLTILLAVCTAIYVAVPLIDRHAEEQAAASYMEYIEGSWVSEYFAFKDRPSECCVELLTVSADGTFVMDYLLPDTENPEGWRDGSWESTYKVIGTVKIDAASQRLMLLYDENGVSYFYDRYFVSMEEGEMFLREYYDEAHTSYYDVCFNKVA